MAKYSHKRQRLSYTVLEAHENNTAKGCANFCNFWGTERENNLQSGRERLGNHKAASQAAILYFMM